MQALKNLIGDLFGYGRCSVTGDTYWRARVALVEYSPGQGVLVLAKALEEVPAEQIAKVAFERGKQSGSSARAERLFSLEEIMAQIAKGCFEFPAR